MKNILISACLLGEPCRYDGKSKPIDESLIRQLKEKYNIVPVCPEILGGLPVPRPPCEIKGERVVRKDGTDCTVEYQKGAEETLRLADANDVTFCLLKSKSPSCGRDFVYDGSFLQTLHEGNGVTVKLLVENGYTIYTENEIKNILN